MKVQRLTFKTHGSPSEVLSLEEIELPKIRRGQVLLQILASPINPADLNYIEGTYGIKPPLPAFPGIEASARIIESQSEKFIPGDLVIPIAKIDAWASHALAEASDLIKLPPNIDPLQAAMLKVNPATAYVLLNHFRQLLSGDTVVLNAANSGVGQCIVQLAAQQKIRTICFVRNLKIAEELKTLGASHVFPDTPEGFALAKETLGENPAKLAFNCVGGDSALRLMKLLGEGSTHITYGAMAKKPLTIPNGPLIFKNISFKGLWVSRWIQNTDTEELSKVYTQLAQKVVRGTLIQQVDHTYVISGFLEAIQRLSAPERKGKVLFATDS